MGIDITPDGEYVLAVNNDSDTVSVIHTGEAREIMQIGVGVEPLGIAIDHAGRYAYVTNSTDSPDQTTGSVSVLDLSTFEVIDNIDVGRFPDLGIAVSNDDSKLAVANLYDDTVMIFDTARRGIEKTIYRIDGLGPMDVKFGPDDRRLYIAYYGDGTNDHVLAVDLSEKEPDLFFDGGSKGPSAISFSPRGDQFMVSNFFSRELYRRSMDEAGDESLGLTANPYRGVYNGEGDKFFVPCYVNSEAGVTSPGVVNLLTSGGNKPRIEKSIQVGINPSAIAVLNQKIQTSHPGDKPDFTGINLYVAPQNDMSKEILYLNWAIMPPDGVDVRFDVILGIIYKDNQYYAFENRLKSVQKIDLTRLQRIPKIIRGMRINSNMSGRLPINVSGGVLPGSYRFVVALTDPRDPGRIVYYSFSNGIEVN